MNLINHLNCELTVHEFCLEHAELEKIALLLYFYEPFKVQDSSLDE